MELNTVETETINMKDKQLINESFNVSINTTGFEDPENLPGIGNALICIMLLYYHEIDRQSVIYILTGLKL